MFLEPQANQSFTQCATCIYKITNDYLKDNKCLKIMLFFLKLINTNDQVWNPSYNPTPSTTYSAKIGTSRMFRMPPFLSANSFGWSATDLDNVNDLNRQHA